MIRTLWTLGLGVMVGVLGTSLAQAQGPAGFGRGDGGMMGGPDQGLIGLMMLDPIHKELGLEGKNVTKVKSLVSSYNNEVQGEMEKAGFGPASFANFQNLDPDLRQKKRQEMGAKRAEIAKKLNEKFIPKIKEALKPEQFQRAQQIQWQAAGSLALADEEMIKALGLEKPQQEKISGITKEYGDKARAIFQEAFVGGTGNFQEAMEKVQELASERDAKATDVLTKEQQEKFASLKGKPFDLAKLMPQGPPGGPPGGTPGRPPAAGRPGKKAETTENKKNEKKDEKKDDKKKE